MSCSVALMGARAEAQSAAPASGADTSEVVVTGTLFKHQAVTANPITDITKADIAQQGITTVADAVRSIPSDNSGTLPPAFPGAFAFGASGVSLRGLTVNSTLVVTDGLRNADYPIGDDGIRAFVDLNTLPLAIVDHIDVLKDGASSQYGADAIAGVVNIVLRPTFQGVESTVEGGGTQHGGDGNEHVDLTVGQGDLNKDRYNFYISGEFQHDDAIKASDRPFPFNTNDLSSIGGVNPGNGQPQTFLGSIYGSVAPATYATPGLVTSGVAVGPTQVLAPGGCGALGRLSTDNLGNQYCAQNLLAGEYDYPRENRGGVYSRFTAQIDPHDVGYVSFSYFQNQVYQADALGLTQIQNFVPQNTAAIALPPLLPNGKLNPNDPFAAAGEAALINYAFSDVPDYTTTTDHAYRLVGDLRGDRSGWEYEVSSVAEHEDLSYRSQGNLSYPNLLTAVTDGTYNFITPSSNSQAIRSFIDPVLAKTATSNLYSLSATATRTLLDLAGGPLKVGFGADARYEDEVNPELNPGGLYEGLGVNHASGHRTVASGFFEVDAPFIKTVDFDVSGRFDHYSDFGNAFSPKATLKWTPIKEFALRGTLSTGFRAPSFAEEQTAAAGGFVTNTLQTAEPAYYAAHNADGYVQPYSIEEVSTPNPNIRPERSFSATFGTVYQPTGWLRASLDYYLIHKWHVIAPGSQAPLLNEYFAGQPVTGGAIIVDNPDPNGGTAGFLGGLPRPLVVETQYENSNSILTDGLDLEISTRFNLPYDVRLTSMIEVTDVFRYDYSQPGVPTFNFVGTESPYNTSSGAGTPRYRANWQTTVSHGPLSMTATIYYTSGLYEDGADIVGNTSCFSSLPGSCHMSDFTDVDLNANYKFNDRINFFINVNNLMDVLPPLDQINYAGINYNPTYDEAGIIGRAFKVGVHVKY